MSPDRPIRVLLADDEPLAREGMRLRLGLERDVEIVGEASDGPEAVEAVRRLEPDLLFLDIQMPGLDGFGVLGELAGSNLPVVVFVTAYDQFAVRAFEVNALDYLLKPYTAERFREALLRARRELAPGSGRPDVERIARLLSSIEETGPYLERLAVPVGDRFLVLKTAEIEYVEAASNYVSVNARGRAHLVRMKLSDLQKALDPKRFARIHRSTLVCLDRVMEVLPDGHGDYEVLLDTGRRLRMSRSHRHALLP